MELNLEPNKIFIKKYINRKLYNTSTNSYITIPKIKELIRDGIQIEVIDMVTKEDITNYILKLVMLTCNVNNDSILDMIRGNK